MLTHYNAKDFRVSIQTIKCWLTCLLAVDAPLIVLVKITAKEKTEFWIALLLGLRDGLEFRSIAGNKLS